MSRSSMIRRGGKEMGMPADIGEDNIESSSGWQGEEEAAGSTRSTTRHKSSFSRSVETSGSYLTYYFSVIRPCKRSVNRMFFEKGGIRGGGGGIGGRGGGGGGGGIGGRGGGGRRRGVLLVFLLLLFCLFLVLLLLLFVM